MRHLFVFAFVMLFAVGCGEEASPEREWRICMMPDGHSGVQQRLADDGWSACEPVETRVSTCGNDPMIGRRCRIGRGSEAEGVFVCEHGMLRCDSTR